MASKFVLRAALVAQKDQNSVSADYVWSWSHIGRCLQRRILSVRLNIAFPVKTKSSMATESELFAYSVYGFVQYFG